MTAPATRVHKLIATLAATAALTSVLSGCASSGYQLVATFDDVGDLQSRGSVQVADVRVGEIGTIKLTRAFKARVVLKLGANVRIPADSAAVLRTTSLLGEKFVELRPGTARSTGTGPFLHDGDRVRSTRQAPELESVADAAINLLGAVEATDIATLTETGAEAFGPHSAELRSLVTSLGAISSSLADRTKQIGAIIDHLDGAASTLAGGADDLRALLTNLATTTKILSDNRDKAITALDQLARLARAQDAVLKPYFTNIDTQIKQVGGIVDSVRQSQSSLDSVLVWLDRFSAEVPLLIPGDFTQIYMRLAPFCTDPRSNHTGCP